MRYVVALLAILLASCASLSRPSSISEISGLWQYPGMQVWVLIESDGSAFQCRVDQDDTLLISKGRYDGAGSVVWDQRWGAERVYVARDGIVFHGIYGKFKHVPATHPLSDDCARALAAV